MLNWLTHYSYIGLYGLLMLGIVGPLPIPDETILTGVGWYITTTHKMEYIPAFLAAFLGSITGITLSFFIGSFGGRLFILRIGKYIHLTEERLVKMELLVEKYGRLALFFGYFVPGVRHFTAIVAGLGQMKYRSFSIPAYTGAAVWVITFLAVGKIFGSAVHRIHFHRLTQLIEPYTERFMAAAILLFLIVACVLAWKHKTK